MKESSVTWLNNLTFDAESGGHHVMIDASGSFGNGRGPTPTGLLLAGVAGCTAMDVVSILTKKKVPFTGLVVRARGEHMDDYPHRFVSIEVVYEVHGRGIDRAAVERAVELSDQKYCSVSATLKQGTEVTTRVELIEPDD